MKYENLEKDCKTNANVKKIFVEVTALGFAPKSINVLNKLLNKHDINSLRINLKISEVALRSSYFLYTQHNKQWKENDILKFY